MFSEKLVDFVSKRLFDLVNFAKASYFFWLTMRTYAHIYSFTSVSFLFLVELVRASKNLSMKSKVFKVQKDIVYPFPYKNYKC